jgi:hypothetical protein
MAVGKATSVPYSSGSNTAASAAITCLEARILPRREASHHASTMLLRMA